MIENKEPDFVNPEGFKWYVDKLLTDWCTKHLNSFPILNAVVYSVYDKDDKKLSNICIDKDTNNVLIDDGNTESMCIKIDILRLNLNEK